MGKPSKRQKLIREKLAIINNKAYPIERAVDFLKSLPPVKFIENLEVAICLGIDPRSQNVRGATLMPFGTGRTVRVAVFAQGEQREVAIQAGADVVGFEDLAEQVKAGNINFDVVIASPEAMRLVGQLGQILGPKGLMPNPKVGTVTTDISTAVKNAKSGQVQYRTEKGGILHCVVGKLDFDIAAIKGNLTALLADVKKSRPTSAKGVFLKKIFISATMGPALLRRSSFLE